MDESCDRRTAGSGFGRRACRKKCHEAASSLTGRGIFGREMTLFIFIIGILMSVTAIAAAWSCGASRCCWQTTVFTVLVFTQLAVALESRSEMEPIFRMKFLGNRSMALALLLTTALQLAVVYSPVGNRISIRFPCRRAISQSPLARRCWLSCLSKPGSYCCEGNTNKLKQIRHRFHTFKAETVLGYILSPFTVGENSIIGHHFLTNWLCRETPF